MAAGAELGITFAQPYGGWSYYISTAYITENPKFLYVADLFPRLRMLSNVDSTGGTTYPNNNTLAIRIWALALKAYKPSTFILYGCVGNKGAGYNPQTYTAYNAYLLQDAAWAQANGMDMFCVGNENLIGGSHTGSSMVPIISLTRSNNVATATFANNHGLTNGDKIFLSSSTVTNFNVVDSESSDVGVSVTVSTPKIITFPSTGSDGNAAPITSITKFERGTTLKTITAFASSSVASGYTTVTSASHGFTGGTVSILGTTHYNGSWFISNVLTNTFDISKSFTGNDATGTATNKTTITANSHTYSNGNNVYITGTTNYDGYYSVSNITTNTFDIVKIYSSNDATGYTTKIAINWTSYEVVRKVKAQGAMCQSIFTRGPIIYTESQGHFTPWNNLNITPGTDIDLMGLNLYGSGDNDANRTAWLAELTPDFAAFGTNLIITEFNVVQDNTTQIGGLNQTQQGFEVGADPEFLWRYNYAQALGITQIYLFPATPCYTLFCNTWPDTGSTNAYVVGSFKAIINKLKGLTVDTEFFGTNAIN